MIGTSDDIINGGIAQLARVLGSYPIGRWFESYCRYHSRPVGQVVKTPPFHGGIMGSSPVRVTTSLNLGNVFFIKTFPRFSFIYIQPQTDVSAFQAKTSRA